MKRAVRICGGPVEISCHVPTNEEYNGYSDALGRIFKDNDDEALVAHRVKYFDLWAEKLRGMEKNAIPDKVKSGIMFKIFELVEVDEKN